MHGSGASWSADFAISSGYNLLHPGKSPDQISFSPADRGAGDANAPITLATDRYDLTGFYLIAGVHHDWRIGAKMRQ
jgi:hypothetical protein